MSKHTEGPWEAKFRPFAPSYEIGKRAANGSLDLIANLKDSVPQGDEREANAKLIAAAPDLLACLQEIVGRWGYPNTPEWHRATR